MDSNSPALVPETLPLVEDAVIVSAPSDEATPVASEETLAQPEPRPYALVLFGASGFVGRQAAQYLAQHPDMVGRSWAIAGRNQERLEAVRARCTGQVPDIVLANAQDTSSLDILAACADVLMSTAGPFALLGSGLVAACVRQRTHYVDITGETPWVRDLIARHHAQAADDGTRIVPLCGFDSVPSDLSAFLAHTTLMQRHGEPAYRVKVAFRLRGGFNGGTLASMFQMFDSGEARMLSDPFLLNPPGTRPYNGPQHADPSSPQWDDNLGHWLAPYFMGPVNSRVVRRSAALLGFSPDFAYREYLQTGAGLGGALAAGSLSFAEAVTQAALHWAPLRRLIRGYAPAPGTGPSEEAINQGSFHCEWLARSASGKQARGHIADAGDPGNRGTTKMLCESALALVVDRDALPGGPAMGGVLTPASAFGDVLLRRLRATGMRIRVNPA
jgi:short subunit dehydrogenase-like uncharacterized protein